LPFESSFALEAWNSHLELGPLAQSCAVLEVAGDRRCELGLTTPTALHLERRRAPAVISKGLRVTWRVVILVRLLEGQLPETESLGFKDLRLFIETKSANVKPGFSSTLGNFESVVLGCIDELMPKQQKIHVENCEFSRFGIRNPLKFLEFSYEIAQINYFRKSTNVFSFSQMSF
jgi:hypothetical protein